MPNQHSCPKCKGALPEGAIFCGNCGTKIYTPEQRKAHKAKQEENTALRIKGLSMATRIRNGVEASDKRYNKRLMIFLFFSLVAIAGLIYYDTGSIHRVLAVPTLGLFVAFIIFFVLSRSEEYHLSRREYYNLPGSTTTSGDHQCLQCGARGIYKRRLIHTNIIRNTCTKCGVILFEE